MTIFENQKNVKICDFHKITKKLHWAKSQRQKHKLCMNWTPRACFDAILIMVTSVFRDESPESQDFIVRIEF